VPEFGGMRSMPLQPEAYDCVAIVTNHSTIDYGELASRIVAAVERDPVDLIEKVAERVAALVLEYPLAMMTEVTVHKPSAPITVPFDDVSVTITRGRAA